MQRYDLFASAQARVSDYIELTKFRLVFLVLFSTFVGFYLASPDVISLSMLFSTLTGTAFVAAGSMVLNQWMERDVDALMDRTMIRPLPSGRVEPIEALVFGLLLSVLGLGILEITVHTPCSLIAAATLLSYLFFYTPMKRVTTHSTLIGALPGALPPLIGWSAAGRLTDPGAWVLFGILFLWQIPHFYAIAWMYKNDYAKARLKIISVIDPDGNGMAKTALGYAIALLPLSLALTVLGYTGWLYFYGALLLGGVLIATAFACYNDMDRGARKLFRASVVYLSLLFILMIVDKA